MGSFLSGVLGGLGEHFRERSLIDLKHNQEVNMEHARVLSHLAESSDDPELAAQLHQEAFNARTAVNKPYKSQFDRIVDEGVRRRRQARIAREQAGQTQGQQPQSLPPTPGSPESGTGDWQSEVSSGLSPLPSSLPPTPPPTGGIGKPSVGFSGQGQGQEQGQRVGIGTSRLSLPETPGPLQIATPAWKAQQQAQLAYERDAAQSGLRREENVLSSQNATSHSLDVERGKGELEREKADRILAQLKEPLTSRQTTQVRMGQAPTPELRPRSIPGYVSGDDLPEDGVDYRGNPVDRSGATSYRMSDGPNGIVFTPTTPPGNKTVRVQDPSSSTGWTDVIRSPNGHEINRILNVPPPPAFAPQTSTGQQVVTIGDKVVQIPNTRTTQRNPGSLPPTSASPAPPGAPPGALPPRPPVSPPPASRTPPGGALRPPGTPPGVPPGGRELGNSPAYQSRLEQNELTPNAQGIMEKTGPTFTMIDRAMAEIKARGWDKESTPMTTFLPRLAYALGFGTDTSAFLGALNMDTVIGAGSILSGTGQRALEAYKMALVHTPAAWHDSGKLQYDKLSAMRERLRLVMDDAWKYGRRFPNMERPAGQGQQYVPPTPGSGGMISVTKGRDIWYFPSQQAADEFKRAAGIP